jgi:hypothetical protein
LAQARSTKDAAMRNDKWTKRNKLRDAGSRRVLEAIKMVSEKMSDFDDDEELPQMPAGVLMKRHPEGGGWLGQ